MADPDWLRLGTPVQPLNKCCDWSMWNGARALEPIAVGERQRRDKDWIVTDERRRGGGAKREPATNCGAGRGWGTVMAAPSVGAVTRETLRGRIVPVRGHVIRRAALPGCGGSAASHSRSVITSMLQTPCGVPATMLCNLSRSVRGQGGGTAEQGPAEGHARRSPRQIAIIRGNNPETITVEI